MEMDSCEETWEGQWGARFGCLMVSFFGFSTFYFAAIATVQRVIEQAGKDAWLLVIGVPFGLFALGIGVLFLYGTVEAFTRVKVDERGVTKQAVYGTRRMDWAYIVSEKMGSKHDSSITLIDDAGHRLRLEPGLLRDPDGLLRAVIDEKLAHLQAAEQRQFGAVTHTYMPERGFGWLWLMLTLMFGGFGGMGLADAEVRSTALGVSLMVVWFAFFVLPFVLLTLHSFTRRVTVTGGAITDISLLRRRAIALDRIESLMVRDVQNKNGTMNITTVVGGGQKITLTDIMPEYLLIRDFLKERAGLQAEKQGLEALPSHERKINRRVFAIIATFFVLAGGGASGYMLQEAGARLAQYALMDTHGTRAQGKVTKQYRTDDPTRYLITYAYQVNGQGFERTSPVTKSDFAASSVGQAVTVIYVPEQPGLARLTNSIGRTQVERQRWFGIGFLIFSLLSPFLIFAMIRKEEKKREAKFLAERAAL